MANQYVQPGFEQNGPERVLADGYSSYHGRVHIPYIPLTKPRVLLEDSSPQQPPTKKAP